MAINLAQKYSDKLDERFRLASVTEKYAGRNFDWDGVNSIKVYSVEPVTVNDYNRTLGANRFGTPKELGDTVQVMSMSRDRAFTFTIDAGNSAEQLNVKQCNRQLKDSWDEVIVPEIDIYRLRRWCEGAGLTGVCDAPLTPENAVKELMLGSAKMSNCRVPKKNRAVFIGESTYINCKLASEIVGVDTLGAQSVSDGVVGFIDGMAIRPVPDDYLPEGVQFVIKYASATADPQKLKTLRAHKNPPGLDGDLGECRIMYDSFVLDSKINGIYVLSVGGLEAPEISYEGGKATVTAGGGASIKYTVDGTNPKNSETAQAYSAPVSLEKGSVIKAYAYKSGALASGVAEYAAV